MDSEKEMIYEVANICIGAEGRWTVTYYGDVPEQGGLERKRGQLTFLNLKDACTFLSRELESQKELYLKLISDKEKAK